MLSDYIPIDTVIEKINRRNIPWATFNIEEIKEWVFECLSKINTIIDKVEIIDTIEIINNKGKLSTNMHSILEVSEGISSYPMRELNIGKEFTDLTYQIFNGMIFTDFATGYIEIKYLAFPELNNSPLIPNNNYYISAVEAYLLYKLGERAYWNNFILLNQFQLVEQDWLFYLPAAQCSTKMNLFKNSKEFRKIAHRHYTV